MLHYLFAMKNGPTLEALQKRFMSNNTISKDTLWAVLKVSPLESYNEVGDKTVENEIQLVSFMFKPIYPNLNTLTITHKDVFDMYFKDIEGLRLDYNYKLSTYQLRVDEVEYIPVKYVSEFGDWTVLHKHVKDLNAFSDLHLKYVNVGSKMFAGMVQTSGPSERFINLLKQIQHMYNDHHQFTDFVISGSLSNELSKLPYESVREFIVEMIAYHYHCNFNLKASDNGVDKLIKENDARLTLFIQMCEKLVELHQPVLEV